MKNLLIGTHAVQHSRRVTVERVLVTAQPLGGFAEAGIGSADLSLLSEDLRGFATPGFIRWTGC